MTDLQPFYQQVQAHYDLSNEFYALFLDPSMTYSCAYFERPDMTLEQAQRAKIDLALNKLDLWPGMTLLDIGCGWGATMLRAATEYGAKVVGLTLSRNQYDYVKDLIDREHLTGVEIRHQGWEEFDDEADRIVSIGAFEHFRRERYEVFFDQCHRMLPSGGRMLLHTIIGYTLKDMHRMNIPVNRDDALFHIFVKREIFPGGQLPQPGEVTRLAGRAGLGTEKIQELQPHYVRTLECWSESLQAHRDEAIALASEEVYERYLKYLTGAAEQFRAGRINVMQFTMVK
ncbi:cyclopropane mycolic acid synthase family methyltransferase [Nocardia sp. CNY236]|uniref:cyclopropane mycolic acid synthase family methyltransferase n=1 Tax=Nocardia sp. CNY236 TaxID=1169152 RepID=UPI00048E6B50|nr:cyclopropane mycolic acid synthase family methyltransferase [Nocardia sp. CNY236]